MDQRINVQNVEGVMQFGDHIEVEGNTYAISDVMPAEITGALFLVPVVRMCDSCGDNPGTDYQTGEANLCASCVNRALEYIALNWVMENIGEYDVPLARTIEALEDDDRHMRAANVPYVDSHSSAMDYIRGMDMFERNQAYRLWGQFIADCLGDPGDSQGRT